jgi:hypothetical protein
MFVFNKPVGARESILTPLSRNLSAKIVPPESLPSSFSDVVRRGISEEISWEFEIGGTFASYQTWVKDRVTGFKLKSLERRQIVFTFQGSGDFQILTIALIGGADSRRVRAVLLTMPD